MLKGLKSLIWKIRFMGIRKKLRKQQAALECAFTNGGRSESKIRRTFASCHTTQEARELLRMTEDRLNDEKDRTKNVQPGT